MEQKEEVPMKITSSEMLQKAGIPLIAQVLVTGRGELVTNFDRSYSLEHYNKVMIDYDGGNCLYVTAEEYTEIILADKLGDAYQPKQWLYGFYWKISDDADFSKVGLEPTLDYNLSNGSTIPYPRHMPVGGYMCLHPTFGYITVEEMNLVRQLQSDKHDNVADSSLHLSSLGAPNPSVVSQNHIKVFAQSGEKPIQLTEVTIDSIERLAQFYRMLPHGHEVPPLSTTMHDVYDDVNGLFQIVDTSVVPDLVKTEWVDNKWLTWSPDKLTEILKKCIQSLTAATNVTAIKSKLKCHTLTSTASNWSNHQTFLTYKKAILKVLRDNSVMEKDTEQINPSALSISEQAVIANALFDNLPSSNEMEKAFKDVVRVGSANSDGKFGTITSYIDKTTDVFRERIQIAAGVRKFALGLEGAGEKRSSDSSNGNDNNKRGRQSDNAEVLAHMQEVESRIKCGGCGYSDGRCRSKETCKYKGHPGFNTESTSWDNSTNGKGYKNNIPPRNPNAPKGCNHLVWEYKPDGTTVSPADLNGLSRPIVKQKPQQYSNNFRGRQQSRNH